MQQVRRITVSYATRCGKLAMEVRDGRGEVVRENVKRVFWTCPSLKLCGNWMAEAGFRPGDPVRVEVSGGRLVIMKEGGEAR